MATQKDPTQQESLPQTRQQGMGRRPPLSAQWHRLQRYMDRLMGEEGPGPWGMLGPGRGFSPSLNVFESESSVEVVVELPGVQKEDIKLSLAPDGDVLWIRGDRSIDEEREDAGYYIYECQTGTFARSVALPAPVVAEGVETSLANGLLRVKLSKQNPNRRGEQPIDFTD